MGRTSQVVVASTLLALSGASGASFAGHVDVSAHQQRFVQVDSQPNSKATTRRTALPVDNSIVRVSKASDSKTTKRASVSPNARLSIVSESSAMAKGKSVARGSVTKSSESMSKDRAITRRSSIAQRATTTQGTMKVVTNSSLAMAESREVTNSSNKVREKQSVTRSSTQIRDTQTVQRTSRALRAAKDDASVMKVAPKSASERTAKAKSTTTKKVASANAKRSSRA